MRCYGFLRVQQELIVFVLSSWLMEEQIKFFVSDGEPAEGAKNELWKTNNFIK